MRGAWIPAWGPRQSTWECKLHFQGLQQKVWQGREWPELGWPELGWQRLAAVAAAAALGPG